MTIEQQRAILWEIIENAEELKAYHKQALYLYAIQGLDFQQMEPIMERDNCTVLVCYTQAMTRLIPVLARVKPRISESFFCSLLPPFRGLVKWSLKKKQPDEGKVEFGVYSKAS